MNMPYIEHNNDPKVIRTRSGCVHDRLKKLGRDHIKCVILSILGNVVPIVVRQEEKQSQHGEINYAGLL